MDVTDDKSGEREDGYDVIGTDFEYKKSGSRSTAA